MDNSWDQVEKQINCWNLSTTRIAHCGTANRPHRRTTFQGAVVRHGWRTSS